MPMAISHSLSSGQRTGHGRGTRLGVVPRLAIDPMAWDFSLDFSKPRKGPATPAFSGDWRGGGALHQAPQLAPRRAAPARKAVVENESDEEAPDTDKPQVRLVWDAAKGQLVPAKEGEEEPKAEAETKEEEAEAEGESEEEEEAAGDEDVDVEAESRTAFLSEASTPELIKQAVAVGGPLADSTKDKWVLDKATQLYFKYDTPSQKMYCWNSSQGCMYHWKERGKMSYLWAGASGADSAPPTGPPQVPPTPKAASAGEAPALATESSDALWVTVIPPQVLSADFEDANAEVEEELELNAKAIGAVIGKGGKGIKEIEQATGIKTTTLNAREAEGNVRRLVLKGSRGQIAAAKSAVEQRVTLVLGPKMAEKVQKHWNAQLLERKRTESGSEAAKGGVRGLSDFALKHNLKAVMARKLSRLDAQLQRYMLRHFQPLKAKPVDAPQRRLRLRGVESLLPRRFHRLSERHEGYMTQLFKFPQRWRLEALYEDGELDGEICETIPLRTSAVIGKQQPEEATEEQVIELEVNMALGQKEASKVYGDVKDQHCRLLRMGNDFYVMALESAIGTLVDGQKIRETDGPVPIRDGTTLTVGKYLFYCEVGSETSLQDRRKKLLAGERFWKEGAASLQQAEAAAEAKEEPEDAELDAEGEEAVDVLFTDGSDALEAEAEAEAEAAEAEETEEMARPDKSLQNQEQLDALSRKRKRDEDAPMPEAVVDEVDELAEVDEEFGRGQAGAMRGVLAFLVLVPRGLLKAAPAFEAAKAREVDAAFAVRKAMLDRLAMALAWEELTLQELRRECQTRDVCFTGLRSRSEPEQRKELGERLFVNVCHSAWETQGIPVKRFGSAQAAAKVVERMAQLSELSLEELKGRWRELQIPPEAGEPPSKRELLKALEKLAMWQEMPLKELQKDCREMEVSTSSLSGLRLSDAETRKESWCSAAAWGCSSRTGLPRACPSSAWRQ
ncbi:unnamed protein product [Effrenium voratum]|nr:unnamed protein product [Effrenium voratum]